MRKPKFNFPIKLIIIILIIFLGALFTVRNLLKLFKASDYFKIKDIIIFSEENIVDLSYLKGENIFTVDLQKEAGYLMEQYPIYRKISLVRILPNRISINFIKRKPVAVIKLYRYFYVNEEAILFDMPEELENQDLPLILGLETKIFGPKIGRRYNIKELTIALNIIKELNLNRALKDYKIKRIDVANLSNASFTIKELEIKLDAYNIKDKFNILAGLLNQLKNDLNNIKYIDLRFKEPVIKLNEAKTYGTK